MSLCLAGWAASSATLPRPEPRVAAEAIVLPPRVVAGQGVTLAVLSAEGRLLPGVAVEVSGGRTLTTDESGRALFTAPAERGVLLADIPGTSVEAAAIVLAALPSSRMEVRQVPKIISLHDRFTISGSGFQGQADFNRVQLGEHPAAVLAASPVSLVLLAGPDTPTGPALLAVKSGGAEASALTELIGIEFDPLRDKIAPGAKAQLLVRIRGTISPQQLEVRNLSPAVVRFRHGDVQFVTTSGGVDNSAEIELRGERAGNFSFRVRLWPLPPDSPDLEATREFLRAARHAASPSEARQVEKLILQMERRPPDAMRVQNELEKMLAAHPQGDFRRLLRAALQTLAGL